MSVTCRLHFFCYLPFLGQLNLGRGAQLPFEVVSRATIKMIRLLMLITITFDVAYSIVHFSGPGLSRFFEVPTRYFYVTIEENGKMLVFKF